MQPARTELPLTPSESEVHVQPLPPDSTVVLLVGRERPLSNKSTFAFQQYDQGLRLRNDTPLEVPDEFDFNRLCAEGNTVYALFTSRSTPGRLLAAAYNGRLGQVRTQQFDTRLSREIVELKALEGRLFATVLLNDQLHVTALLLNVATGQMQYLSSIYEPLPTQLTFVADAASRRAEYVLSQTNGRKSRLLLKQLTEQGQLVSSEFVQAESERSLITAQLTPPQDTTARLLMGTYSLRDPSYAQGLFATDLRPVAGTGAKPPLRFYDFLRLKHFFDYLKPARQARLRRRTERRMARSVPPLRWRYRLLLHELLPQPDGGYVLVAEVYYPHYRYNSYGSYPAPFNAGATQCRPPTAATPACLTATRPPTRWCAASTAPARCSGTTLLWWRTCAAATWKKPCACKPCPTAGWRWPTSTKTSCATSSSTGPSRRPTTTTFPFKPVLVERARAWSASATRRSPT